MTIPLSDAQPGDLVFCDSVGFVGRAIRFVTRGKYNHTAWLDRQVDGVWFVGQAVGRGVTVGAPLSTIAPGGSYVIVRLPDGVDRAKVLEFAHAQVGDKYGFVTVASILVTLFTPKFINVMLPNTFICSAVAAFALLAGGWIKRFPDWYQVTPQQLFDALEAA